MLCEQIQLFSFHLCGTSKLDHVTKLWNYCYRFKASECFVSLAKRAARPALSLERITLFCDQEASPLSISFGSTLIAQYRESSKRRWLRITTYAKTTSSKQWNTIYSVRSTERRWKFLEHDPERRRVFPRFAMRCSCIAFGRVSIMRKLPSSSRTLFISSNHRFWRCRLLIHKTSLVHALGGKSPLRRLSSRNSDLLGPILD